MSVLTSHEAVRKRRRRKVKTISSVASPLPAHLPGSMPRSRPPPPPSLAGNLPRRDQ